MRSTAFLNLIIGVVLAGMYGCVSTVGTPGVQNPTVQAPVATTLNRERQPKDVDPCVGQTKFEVEASENDSNKPTDTSIRLLSISPPAGFNVTENAVLEAHLAYSVRDFQAGQYRIMAQFDTDNVMATTDGAFKDHPVPQSARGRLDFCFPLRYVWNLPNIKRPFNVRFLLNKVYESGISQPLARTETVSFSVEGATSSNTGSAALGRVEKYDSALLSVYSTLEYYEAEAGYCTKQFPELASTISKNFDDWTRKNSNLKTEIDSLVLKWAASRTGGDTKKAQHMVADVRQMGAPNFKQDTPEQARGKCLGLVYAMTSPANDPESKFASELALIRQSANSIEPH